MAAKTEQTERSGRFSLNRLAARAVFWFLSLLLRGRVKEAAPDWREGGDACVTPSADVLERFRLPEDWRSEVVYNGETKLRWGVAGASDDHVALILPGTEEPIELFGEMIRRLTEGGAEVYAVDWRHQGRSGRDPLNDQSINVADFNLYLDDLDVIAAAALDDRLAAFKGRFTVVGSSLGGHLALLWAARRQDIDRMTLITPAIRTAGGPRWMWELASWSAVASGRGNDFTEAQGAWDEALSASVCGGLNASDYEPRAAAWHHLLVGDPALRVGGPTYNWVRGITRSTRAIDGLAPGFTTARIEIFSATQDLYVDNAAHHAFARRHPNASVTVLEAKHSPFLERDEIFEQVLRSVAGGALAAAP